MRISEVRKFVFVNYSGEMILFCEKRLNLWSLIMSLEFLDFHSFISFKIVILYSSAPNLIVQSWYDNYDLIIPSNYTCGFLFYDRWKQITGQPSLFLRSLGHASATSSLITLKKWKRVVEVVGVAVVKWEAGPQSLPLTVSLSRPNPNAPRHPLALLSEFQYFKK